MARQEQRDEFMYEQLGKLLEGISNKSIGIPELIYEKNIIEQGAYGNIKKHPVGLSPVIAALKMIDAEINRQEREMAVRVHKDDINRRLDAIDREMAARVHKDDTNRR
jgi:hypothetical protein